MWRRLWEVILKIFSPTSGHWLREGLRLMAVNAVYMLLAGGIWYGVYKAVAALQSWHIPIPQPVGLMLLALGIPYCVIWFAFGKRFGAYNTSHPLIRGLCVGIISVIPDILYIAYIRMQFEQYSFITEADRIVSIILSSFSVLLPVMSALGSVDGYSNKKGYH